MHFKRSTNGGQSWVNEGTASAPITGYQQWSPFLSANSAGRLFLTFYNFLNSSSFPSRLYSQASTDNGASFGDSYPHATVDSDPRVGESVTDYIGAIAPPDNPLPTTLWMDFRNGTLTDLRGDAFFDQKLHLASNVSTATAGNGQRKLVKGQAANEYHLVYEANGEVWYTKTTDGGANWSVEKLISERSGTNSFPCIAERGGRIYVVWQKLNGSSYDVYFHKSTDGGATWPDGNRQTRATGVGSNPPLPVITSPATDKLTLVSRTASNLTSQISTNDGGAWSSSAVPSTGATDSSPSLAPTTTYWGSGTRSCLAFARTTGAIYYVYCRNGPDSTAGWNAVTKNLSQIVPGTYSGHQKPSLAQSGTSGDKTLHVAWEAIQTSSGYRLIIHRKATDWGTWPSVYSTTYYQEQQLPSLTGLINNTAELLFQYVSQAGVYKMHYDGSS